jgi:hypothetical protein
VGFSIVESRQISAKRELSAVYLGPSKRIPKEQTKERSQPARAERSLKRIRPQTKAVPVIA